MLGFRELQCPYNFRRESRNSNPPKLSNLAFADRLSSIDDAHTAPFWLLHKAPPRHSYEHSNLPTRRCESSVTVVPLDERSQAGRRARNAALIARDRTITWSGCIHRQRDHVRHEVELRDDSLIAGQSNVAGAGPSASIAPADEGRTCCWGRSQCDQTIGWEGRAAGASAIDASLIGTCHGPGSRSNLLH